MESEALRINFQSITMFPGVPVPLDGNNLKLLSPGFVVTLGGKVGAKPRKNVNGIVIDR